MNPNKKNCLECPKHLASIEQLNDELTTLKKKRISSLDTKFCLPRNHSFAKKMEYEFNAGRCVSLDEIGEHFHTIKLNDEEKKDYIILEFSFLLTNRDRQPMLISRGQGSILTTGCSVLQSFTPTMLSPQHTVRSLDDFRVFFAANLRYKKDDYKLSLLGLARNERKGRLYYFVLLEAHFPNVARTQVRSDEDSDFMIDHIDLSNEQSVLFRAMVKELADKPVDRLAMFAAYKNIPGLSRDTNPASMIGGKQAEMIYGKQAKALLKKYDAFISHASEDIAFSTELARILAEKYKLKIWHDADVLCLGDKLGSVIKDGIAASRFGIVVVSKSFLGKRWTLEEWNLLKDEATRRRRDVLLSVWWGVTPKKLPRLKNDIMRKNYEGLADLKGVVGVTSPEEIAERLAMRIDADRGAFKWRSSK